MLAVVDLADALEERIVEGNLVLQFGQHRLHLLLNLGKFRRLVGLGEREEHAPHVVHRAPTLLVGQDSVLEGSRVGVAHDGGYLVALLLDGTLEGWQIVGGLDLTEVGCSVGQLTLH